MARSSTLFVLNKGSITSTLHYHSHFYLMLNPHYFKMFKKSSKKKGAIRKRKLSENEEQKDDEVDQDEMEKLKLAKLKRELLTKKAGVSAVALAKGKKISKKAELTDDPFKLKSGKSRSIHQIREYLD